MAANPISPTDDIASVTRISISVNPDWRELERENCQLGKSPGDCGFLKGLIRVSNEKIVSPLNSLDALLGVIILLNYPRFSGALCAYFISDSLTALLRYSTD